MGTLDWVLPDVLGACAYPASDSALAELAAEDVTLIINLHVRAHAPEQLEHHGIREMHVPVTDFTPPSPRQISACIEEIEVARRKKERVVVHCGAGLGRTGTLIACYLVSKGAGPDDAIAHVRRVRPGSIETDEQVETVWRFADQQ